MQTIVFSPIWEFFLPHSAPKYPDLPTLGRAIRHMREQSGISAEELAATTGIARQRIDSLERGRLDPTYETLFTLADGLGVKLSELLSLAERLTESPGA
jgi:transcriptional regulator with XRE-family HTH domain